MKILSFDAGTQSTALAMMSCENASADWRGLERPYPLVPVYDLVTFCVLDCESPWVREPAEFVQRYCKMGGMRYEMLHTPCCQDLRRDSEENPQHCALDWDHKIDCISQFVRQDVLGYQKDQQLREEDKKAHEIHFGFDFEERHCCKDSQNPMFVHRFPLVDMQFTWADSYAYLLNEWGLDTKVSACADGLLERKSGRSAGMKLADLLSRVYENTTIWVSENPNESEGIYFGAAGEIPLRTAMSYEVVEVCPEHYPAINNLVGITVIVKKTPNSPEK